MRDLHVFFLRAEATALAICSAPSLEIRQSSSILLIFSEVRVGPVAPLEHEDREEVLPRAAGQRVLLLDAAVLAVADEVAVHVDLGCFTLEIRLKGKEVAFLQPTYLPTSFYPINYV